ncbi:hypothetical protein PILCRDRAFT_94052 [Piloderma croceum F 1598]|uniref:Uncharacterized protein n=2 Tax=Piloderma croceum (strain F 1598) TaxID=765440 RepID=A0A0C3B1B0_PILCF|nr:hypothetical protein PILCRDRAFT_94052 [Piloderma croceum F 1598]
MAGQYGPTSANRPTSISNRIKHMRKEHTRLRPRTVLKVAEVPSNEVHIMVPQSSNRNDNVPQSSNGNDNVSNTGHGQFNMKELAKELAPLVASAMRNTENLTRELFKFHLNIDEDADFVFHQPPSEKQLREFANDPSKGPSLADAHFDVKAGMLSDWNKKLLRLLQVDFQSKLPDICARVNMSLPLRSDKYYTNLVSERFQRLAQIWKQGQPKLTPDGVLEAAEERFRSRLAIVERVIKVKTSAKDEDRDLGVWKWLQDVLLRYQADGMSSDDTDTDGTGTIYWVKILVWRRNIDQYVQMIDDERRWSADIFSGSRAKSVTCVQSPENPKSSRQPPGELPATLFNANWLEDNDDYCQIMLDVSKDDFPWIEFMPEQRQGADIV